MQHRPDYLALVGEPPPVVESTIYVYIFGLVRVHRFVGFIGGFGFWRWWISHI